MRWRRSTIASTAPFTPVHPKSIGYLKHGIALVSSTRNSAVATFVAGLALLIPASFGLLGAVVPTKLCPFPALTMLPALVLSDWGLKYAAVTVPMLLFFRWHRGLFFGAATVPRRSYALLASLTVLSLVYFVWGWKPRLHYQGVEYTRVVRIVSAAWNALLVFAFARAWRKGTSFRTSLFLHWMLFAWLAWYAFPYLGELP
jgi:hypothetical protein